VDDRAGAEVAACGAARTGNRGQPRRPAPVERWGMGALTACLAVLCALLAIG
jgi:hypothetical protein